MLNVLSIGSRRRTTNRDALPIPVLAGTILLVVSSGRAGDPLEDKHSRVKGECPHEPLRHADRSRPGCKSSLTKLNHPEILTG
jgi:hypothetical protein